LQSKIDDIGIEPEYIQQIEPEKTFNGGWMVHIDSKGKYYLIYDSKGIQILPYTFEMKQDGEKYDRKWKESNNCILDRCTRIQNIDYMDLDKEDLVIFFAHNQDGSWRDTYCISRTSFEKKIQDADTYLAKWVAKEGKEIEPTGHGGKPDRRWVYWRIPFLHPEGGDWRFDTIVNIKRPGKTITFKKMRSNLPAFKITSIGKERLGNMSGSMGVGLTHGQDELEVFEVENVLLKDLPEVFKRCSKRVPDCQECDLDLDSDEDDGDMRGKEDEYENIRIDEYDMELEEGEEYIDHEESML
jgi:hypothetical protein